MSTPALASFSPRPSPVHFIVWRDVLVVIDDCTARTSAYETLRRLLAERSKLHASGLGCLMIVPASATAPSEEVRKAIQASVAELSVRCLCWLVEGSGFQGAVARSVLTGLRLVGHPRFPTHIASNLEDAVAWVLPHLEGGPDRLAQARAVTASIRAQRAAGPFIVF
jgi:hypothetical protein